MHVGKNCSRFLFSMTNGKRNAVIAMRRFRQGALCLIGAFPTGGAGSGDPLVDPLASQGAVAVSPNGQFLYAANAADNTISVLSVNCGQLLPVDIAFARGAAPISLAYFHGLLYVANRGDKNTPSNIAGFRVLGNGHLMPIEGADVALSQPDACPACLTLSPCGRYLAVSERTTHRISLFAVEPCGALTPLSVNRSSGAEPLGLVFTREGILLVCEVGTNALSSYAVKNDALRVISPSVPNGQAGTCKVAASPNGKHAYTANPGTGNLSHFAISPRGALSYVDSVSSLPACTGVPVDLGIEPSGCFLYVLNGNRGSISALSIECDGNLSFLCAYQNNSLPINGAQGLALS